MASVQLVTHIDYPFCNSHSQQLSMVCLEKKCLDHLLVCPLCESDQHSGHKTVSLKDYLQQAVGKEGNQHSILEEMRPMEEMKEKLLDQLDKLRSGFLSEMYELQQKVLEYFNNVEDKFLRISSFNSSKNILKMINSANESRSPEKFHHLVRNLRLFNSSPAQEPLKHYISCTHHRLITCQAVLHSFKIEDNFKSLKSLFSTVKDPSFRSTYQWSTQKAQKIQTNGLVACQTASSSNGERFALMTNQESGNEDITVGVKVLKLKGWIGLGICLHNVIVNGNYKFNYTQNFHGSYLISTNGYSWSHSQTAFNSAQKSFIYSEGDVIKISYEVEKRRVLFENPKKMSSFSLEVIDPPSGDYYVPCVNMCNPGDEVQIVNDLD